MNKYIIIVLIIYLLIINIIAAIITFSDKKRAVKGNWRIKESTLMIVGFLGGATLEYIVMKLIHHKTKHIKFMLGLPLEMVLHYALIILIITKVASV